MAKVRRTTLGDNAASHDAQPATVDASRAPRTPQVLMWTEHGALDESGVEYLTSIWRRAERWADKLICCTSPRFGRYKHLQSLARETRLLPGLKIGNLPAMRADMTSRDAWTAIAHACTDIAGMTNSSRIVFEAETLMLWYWFGKEGDHPLHGRLDQLTEALKCLPDDLEYVWYPFGIGSEGKTPTYVVQERQEALFEAVERANVRMEWCHGASRSRLPVQRASDCRMEPVMRRLGNMVDQITLEPLSGYHAWPAERFAEALSLVQTPEVMVWAGWSAWDEIVDVIERPAQLPAGSDAADVPVADATRDDDERDNEDVEGRTECVQVFGGEWPQVRVRHGIPVVYALNETFSTDQAREVAARLVNAAEWADRNCPQDNTE